MPRILVVDDEEIVRRFVQRVLEGFGYTVTVAETGAEALQYFEREGAFDLLITDFNMPQMRGDELASAMRQRQPWLKVVYLTAFVDGLVVAHPEFQPHETALEKPPTRAQLHDVVSIAIYGHRGGPPKP